MSTRGTRRRLGSTLLLLAGCGTVSCGTSDQSVAEVKPLEPDQKHYGKTYAEWASEWWKWLYQLDMSKAGGRCVDPLADPTGADCAYGQDPNSSVFFLAGNRGGKLLRTKCVAPKDKAILIPIINIAGDNGGVAQAEQLSEEDLIDYVEDGVDRTDVKSLRLTLDGEAIEDLDRFRVSATRFSYVVPPIPNAYSCGGFPFSGAVDPSFQGGHYVILPALEPGEHELHFEATRPGMLDDFRIDITYRLKVQ